MRFTAWKARAIREDRAEETRRRIKVGTVVQLDDGRWWPVGKRGKPLTCPYGEVGRVHWIQEPWRPTAVLGVYELASRHPNPDYDYSRWRPAHTMPWLACDQRIVKTSLRVERIQNITIAGVIREGLHTLESFIQAWAAIHTPTSWYDNEWVWVIGFQKYAAQSAENTKNEA